MKNNRLLLYLLVFIVFVVAISLYGNSTTKQYSPEKVNSYVNEMRRGIQDINKRAPIYEIQEEKKVSKQQVEQIIGGVEQTFSAYLELISMGVAFDYLDDSKTETEDIFVAVHGSLLDFKEKMNREIMLTDQQVAYLTESYKYLYDLYQLDMHNMKLDQLIKQMEEVSQEYADLAKKSLAS